MLNKCYQETIDWLFNQFPSYQQIGSSAYKPTLENIQKLCNHFGNPETKLKFIHVAGSNGKGSVSSMLASILCESGYRTGLFTSPHIKDFRERIRINGEMISEESVIDFVSNIKELNLGFEPSFFEITFVLSLLHFEKHSADICVIETGLGGRLDATNIISPVCSIITSISLEHTQILGDTLEKIAFEKAGIIKQGKPVFISNQIPEEAIIVIKNRAGNLGSNIELCSPVSLPDSIYPHYQQSNFGIVKSALQFLTSQGFQSSSTSIELGLKNIARNTGFRGRMQIIQESPRVILDVSHNPEGIQATLSAIQNRMTPKERLFVIYGSSSDKDLTTIAQILPINAIYYFTTFDHTRSATMEQLRKAFNNRNFSSLDFFSNPRMAYEKALNTASQGDTIIVLGSFFLLEDFF